MGFLQYLIIGLLIIGLIAFVNYANETNLLSKIINSLNKNQIKDEDLTTIHTGHSCAGIESGAGNGHSADSLKIYECDFTCSWKNYQNSYYDYYCINNELVCKCKKDYVMTGLKPA